MIDHDSARPLVRRSHSVARYAAWLALLLAALAPRPAFAQGAMTNGLNHSGGISLAGEIDEWTFTASAGDWISVGIGEQSSGVDPFWPWIRLIGPTGTQVDSSYGALAAHVHYRATTGGTYTVRVASADSGNDATGTYQLTLAKSPGAYTPGDEGGPMTNGTNHAGTIHLGDLDMWTFSANQNDWISLSLGEVTSGTDPFYPAFWLVGPDGAQLRSTYGALAAQIHLRAPTSGTYAVFVATADTGVDATGTYLLTLAKSHTPYVVPPGDEGGPMTNGLNHPGTIHVGDLDMWTFTANQNDWISLALGEQTSGTDPFYPSFWLVGPDGTELRSTYGTLAGQIHIRAPQSGSYSVIVSTADTGYDATGTYLITLAKSHANYVVPPDDQGGPMTNGSNHPGTLHVGDLDMWTFTANQNDWISLALGEVSSGTDPFYPSFWLVGPDGTELRSTYGTLAAQIHIRAPQTGTYLVIVSTADTGYDATGTYLITLAKSHANYIVPPDDQGGPMTNGTNHAGTIHVGDLDMWTFPANQNDWISLALGEVTSGTDPFYPSFWLVGPDGVELRSTYGTLAAQIHIRAPTTGTYSVIVSTADTGYDATGTYLITLAKSHANYVVPPGDEGGPMVNGANHSGAIHVGDLDMWTFEAEQNDALALALGEVTSGTDPFYPSFWLVGPNGVELQSNYGVQSAFMNITAPLTGTYRVIISTADTGYDATGTYRLTLAKTPGSFVVPSDDEGGLMTAGVPYTGTIHVGDLDQWKFCTIQGANINITMTQIGGASDFYPWMRLRNPAGTQISSSAGDLVAQININAAARGIHTLVLSTFDSGQDAVGDYSITVLGARPIVPFTDDVLSAQISLVKALHITELRARINALRVTYGLAPMTWTDPLLTGGVMAKKAHLDEMRTALLAAYAAAKRTQPTFAEAITAQQTIIRASHIAELRAAVLALEC